MFSAKHFKSTLALCACLMVCQALSAAQSQTRLRRRVETPNITITGITINPGFIISMYNVAIQSYNIVGTLPSNLKQWASFVNIAVHNSGKPDYPYFHLTV